MDAHHSQLPLRTEASDASTSTDRFAVATASDPGDRGRGLRTPRSRQKLWVPMLLGMCLVFLALQLPHYVGFDPGRSLVPIRADYPAHYPLLVAHILFGSVALLAGCLQVWPWFRNTYRTAHRWVGRSYVFAGVLPAGIAVLGVAPVSSTGFVSSVGNTMLAVLWLISTVNGYRAARARRYGQHRVWMIRSFALTTSIVLNRVWQVPCFLILAPQLHTTFGGDEAAMIQAAAGASVWLSWIVNLLIAEWWLLRTPSRSKTAKPGARGHAVGSA